MLKPKSFQVIQQLFDKWIIRITREAFEQVDNSSLLVSFILRNIKKLKHYSLIQQVFNNHQMSMQYWMRL